MDYPGKIITKNATAPTQASASGVWTVDDALIALRSNTWPIAGVLNPISKSLRFNSADSAYLNRTPASAGNRKTWTLSTWFKRSALPTSGYFSLFGADSGAGSSFYIAFDNSTQQFELGQGATVNRKTTQIFRDPSAWYHLVVAMDTTQATASDRLKIYINGSQITAFATSNDPSLNSDFAVNNNVAQSIGADIPSSGARNYFNGYMTEVYLIDGQALTPSSFGATDAQTGQWIPKKYTGTYGTNGFYVNFSDSASTGALGTDYSGNGNNWTPNNFSVTAGAGNDSLTDVPTPWIAYSTNAEVGGVIRGNYCTWNPLDRDTGATYTTYSNGNLDCTANGYRAAVATVAVTSGKWYWEVVPTGNTGSVNYMIGVADANTPITTRSWTGANGWAYFQNGNKFNNSSGSSYGASYTTNDVIGVALDMDAGTVVFYKNGVSQGTAFSTLSGKAIQPMVSDGSSVHTMNYTANFGQRPFAYTPPAGFKSLCATNLPTPTIGATTTTQADDYFNVVLWTGTGGGRTITGVGFQPDFVWGKGRSGSATYPNLVWDAVRGTNLNLTTNNTGAEENAVTGTGNGGIGTSASDGFTIVAGTSTADNLNALSPASTYVAWAWKANGTGSTNTAGSITSTVSANTTAGFSIVTYTGTGANATVGHGLGVAPSMIIQKNRTGFNWRVYHVSTGNGNELYLDLTTAATSASTWNNTTPTSTVFSIGSGSAINGSGNACVAYCFAPIAGYSAFGSYVGGSSVKPFVYCGFRPAYIMIKYASGVSSASWVVWDNKRNTYNAANSILTPNTSNAEFTGSVVDIDFLSNGFCVRGTDGSFNDPGVTYIFAAFAEFPFKFANAR